MIADESSVRSSTIRGSSRFCRSLPINGNLGEFLATGILQANSHTALLSSCGSFIKTEARGQRGTSLNALGDLEFFQGIEKIIHTGEIRWIVVTLGNKPFAVLFDQVGRVADALNFNGGHFRYREGIQQFLSGLAGGGGGSGLFLAEFDECDTAGEGDGDDPEDDHLAFIHGGR